MELHAWMHRVHLELEGGHLHGVWCNKSAEPSLANGRGQVQGARRSPGGGILAETASRITDGACTWVY